MRTCRTIANIGLLAIALSTALIGAEPPAAPAKPKSTPTPAKLPKNAIPRAKEVVQLPSPITDIVVGGAGRYLVAALQDQRVAIIDVAEKKVANLIPADDEKFLIAAGATRFVVLQQTKQKLARYRLDSGEQELIVDRIVPCSCLAMGCSSEGPLFVGSATESTRSFVNLETLYDAEIEQPAFPAATVATASALGDRFATSNTSASRSGGLVIEISGNTVKLEKSNLNYGPIRLSANGRLYYTDFGQYFGSFKNVDGIKSGPTKELWVPAVTGSLYLGVTHDDLIDPRLHRGVRFSRQLHNDNDLVHDLTLPGWVADPLKQQKLGLGIHRRMFFLNSQSAIATIPLTLDQVVIEHFDVLEEYNKRGRTYLYVESLPPQEYQRGKAISYQLDTKSKHGVEEYKISRAVKGMEVSPEGLVTWTPPADFPAGNVQVLVSIRDKSGYTIYHELRLRDAGITQESAATLPRARTRAKSTVDLPGRIADTAVAAGGRFLIAVLKDTKKLAIVDVHNRELAHVYENVDDPQLKIAGGATKFVVAKPSQGILSRYSLETWERELTAYCDPSCLSLGLGPSSEGPLYMTSQRSSIVIDLSNLRESYRLDGATNGAKRSAVNGKGDILLTWTPGHSWEVIDLIERKRTRDTLNLPNYVYPSSDGRMVYSNRSSFSVEEGRATRINSASMVCVPAATGPYYLGLPTVRGVGNRKVGLRLDFFVRDEPKALLALPEIPVAEDDKLPLGLHERIFLLPAAEAIVTVPTSLNQFEIHDFNPLTEISASEQKYLFVSSTAPSTYLSQHDFAYQLEVQSKSGGVKCQLESGPDGMTVSPEGLVSWTRTATFQTQPVIAVVSIRDDSGRTISHRIAINEVGRTNLLNDAFETSR